MAEILTTLEHAFVRNLTCAERRTLRQLQSQQGAKPIVARRAQMLLLSATGWFVPAIAQVMKCCRRTVRSCIHAFHRAGLAQLASRVLGRPPRLATHLSHHGDLSALAFSETLPSPCDLAQLSRLVPVIPLTVPEIRKLLDELVWNRRRCPAFVLYWSAYRRYKQALAMRSHYLKRGADPPQFEHLRL
jgi:hypothetical protein